jgi:hypothetical protein
MNKQTIAGLVLVVVALFNITPDKVINLFKKGINVTPVVVVDKPEERLIEKVTPIAKLVTSKEDKDRLAIFMNEFGDRKYEKVTMQNINDILTKASQEYFNGSLHVDGKSKYPGLAGKLRELVDVQEVDSQETILNSDQLKELSVRCKALSWALTH